MTFFILLFIKQIESIFKIGIDSVLNPAPVIKSSNGLWFSKGIQWMLLEF